MMAKPMKTLQLHYPMIQFLINTIIIEQIVTLSKYGHDALDICHP